MRTCHLRSLVLLLVILGACPAAAQPQSSVWLFHNATIVNVLDGSLRRDAAIRIEGTKIKAIGSYQELVAGVAETNRVDCHGNYVVPGLWDMHVHLEGAELVEDNKALLPVFLTYGITTVRDCASDLGEQVLEWRNQVNEGKLVGPRIFTAGRKLEGKNSIWKGDLEIDNETELRQALDLLDKYKVDFVKITENTLGGKLFLQSVSAAHQRGYRVSGHVPIDLTIGDLVEAGYTSVEHASYLLRLGSDEAAIAAGVRSGTMTRAQADGQYAQPFDQERATRGYATLARKGLFVCPTLIGGRELAYLDQTDHRADKPLEFLTEKYVSNYQWRIQRMAGDTPEQRRQRKDRYLLLRSQLPRMQQAGLTLMAGSDAAALNTYVYPAESLIQELEIFAEAGLSPLHVLQSATINGPKYFGILHEVGTIDTGKSADMVILQTNPLERVEALRSVQGVFTGGKFYSRNTLDDMVKEAKAAKTRLDNSRK